MENIPWDQYNYAYAERVEGDKKGEYPYYSAKVTSRGTVGTPMGPDALRSIESYLNSNDLNKINNKAIDKCEERLTVISNLFETWYERKEAYTMLLSAGRGILKFLRNWRKPRYWKSLKAGAQPKTLPEAWLAYNFGLMPLVMSCQSALDLLGSDFPAYLVRGASGDTLECQRQDEYYGGGNPWYPLQNWGQFQTQDGPTQVLIEKRVYVKPNLNPNAALLNVLGITSPLSTIFSVLPWGWAVDYFINVSDLLGNFDNKFPGVKIDSVWETRYYKGTYSFYRYEILRWSDGSHVNTMKSDAEFVVTRRFRSNLNKQLTYSLPELGSNQIANLFSAIAVSMKNK